MSERDMQARELVGGPLDGEVRLWTQGCALEIIYRDPSQLIRYNRHGQYEGLRTWSNEENRYVEVSG